MKGLLKSPKNGAAGAQPAACPSQTTGPRACPCCGYAGTPAGELNCPRCAALLYPGCLDCPGCFAVAKGK